eukprot:scaffold555607_cov41-Prasinocladus_malaysianus.AAC.1
MTNAFEGMIKAIADQMQSLLRAIGVWNGRYMAHHLATSHRALLMERMASWRTQLNTRKLTG